MNYRESNEFKVDMVDLSILICELRGYRSMSVRELSAASGVMAYSISNIEQGISSPTFFTMSKLFNGLGYTVAEAYSLLPSINPPLD